MGRFRLRLKFGRQRKQQERRQLLEPKRQFLRYDRLQQFEQRDEHYG
ncbi:MAG TPA: hypothetical protein VGP76_12710 [Planctomycetaceae bacterium]|nr:hypothetical protein [Planctomycetaceae bacterium]